MEEHSIALVDDHHLMRSGLVATVNNLGGFRVTIEAGHGRELIDALMNNAAPAIAIVDLNMPVMDGYETLAWLRANRPQMLTLALTFDPADDALVRAVRSGARGFLLKNTRPELLKTALDSLLRTGYYYTDETQETIQRYTESVVMGPLTREDLLASITPRELEFLRLVCDEREFTYDIIAQRMDIHRRTVDNFRIELFKKFKVKSKTGLVLFAMRWKLLED